MGFAFIGLIGDACKNKKTERGNSEGAERADFRAGAGQRRADKGMLFEEFYLSASIFSTPPM